MAFSVRAMMQAFFGGKEVQKKEFLWGLGKRGKETDKRINERKKLMTNDRLSWIKQSLKSQISNFKSLFFFICGSFYPNIIPFFAPFLNSFQCGQ